MTVQNVLQGIHKNASDPGKEITVEQHGEEAQDEQKWLCLMSLLIF